MAIARGSLFAACAVLLFAFHGLGEARADVELVGDSRCVDLESLRQPIEQILAEHKPEGELTLVVRVQVQDAAAGLTEIELVIALPDDAALLERSYRLAVQDCPSADDLLLTVIAEFLEELPATRWSALPPPVAPPDAPPDAPPEAAKEASPPSKSDIELGYRLRAATIAAVDAASSRGPEAELGAGIALSFNSQAVSLGVLARGGTSQDLGAGRFRATSLLGELGWRRGNTFSGGIQLRAGAVRVAGSGFAENFVRYLPWVEAGARLGYRWRSLDLGVQLLASPLRHQVSIENREDSLWLPRFRLGIDLEWRAWSKKL